MCRELDGPILKRSAEAFPFTRGDESTGGQKDRKNKGGRVGVSGVNFCVDKTYRILLRRSHIYHDDYDHHTTTKFCSRAGAYDHDGRGANGVWSERECVYGFARRQRSEERRVGKECRSRWSPY